jgi:hypothetical protein
LSPSPRFGAMKGFSTQLTRLVAFRLMSSAQNLCV